MRIIIPRNNIVLLPMEKRQHAVLTLTMGKAVGLARSTISERLSDLPTLVKLTESLLERGEYSLMGMEEASRAEDKLNKENFDTRFCQFLQFHQIRHLSVLPRLINPILIHKFYYFW